LPFSYGSGTQRRDPAFDTAFYWVVGASSLTALGAEVRTRMAISGRFHDKYQLLDSAPLSDSTDYLIL
jgi:hypothetical protein